jgi:hypothetical protein
MAWRSRVCHIGRANTSITKGSSSPARYAEGKPLAKRGLGG